MSGGAEPRESGPTVSQRSPVPQVGTVAQGGQAAGPPLAARAPMPPAPPHPGLLSEALGGPTYLLQPGVPRELLHGQGEALGQLQPARADAPPEQHPPVRGHAQHLEAVAVPGLGPPKHLGHRDAGLRSGKPRSLPSLPPPPSKTNGHPPVPPLLGKQEGEFWGRPRATSHTSGRCQGF